MEAITDWVTHLKEIFIDTGFYKLMLSGLKNTLIITAGALVIGLVIGSLLAVLKDCAQDSSAVPMRIVNALCDIYVTVIRGVPVVVLLLLCFLALFKNWDGIAVAILTFGINSGAYMAELIRSGINAVDKGQMEAGRSLGLSKFQTMRKIVFPQAVRYIIPAIGNEFIALLKETSVAGYVAVDDLTRAGNLVRNNTFDAINPLMVVALTYLIMVIGLTQLQKLIERRLSKSDKR